MFVAVCAALLTDFLALATIVFVALAFGALFIFFKKFCLFLFGNCNLIISFFAEFLITDSNFFLLVALFTIILNAVIALLYFICLENIPGFLNFLIRASASFLATLS